MRIFSCFRSPSPPPPPRSYALESLRVRVAEVEALRAQVDALEAETRLMRGEAGATPVRARSPSSSLPLDRLRERLKEGQRLKERVAELQAERDRLRGGKGRRKESLPPYEGAEVVGREKGREGR